MTRTWREELKDFLLRSFSGAGIESDEGDGDGDGKWCEDRRRVDVQLSEETQGDVRGFSEGAL